MSTILNAFAFSDSIKVAILYRDEQITYGDLNRRIQQKSEYLRKIIKEGYRIVLESKIHPELVINAFAVMQAGGIPVLKPPFLRPNEDDDIINDVKANMIQSGDEWNILSESVEQFNNNSEIIFYTSGSTGKPKGVIHTKDTILTPCVTEGKLLGINSSDVIGGTIPLSFTYGFGALAVIPFLFNTTVSIFHSIPSSNNINEILKMIEKNKISIFYSTPSTYRMMLKAAKEYDLSSLRLIVTAGEMMGTGLYRRIRRLIPNVQIIEHLGCTESFHAICSNVPGNVKPGSIGLELPCYSVKIFDGINECPPNVLGKLAFCGPVGRYISEEKVQKWHYTGDIAYKDSEGFLWYVSRNDDMIKTAGYLVSPHEIENILQLYHFVSEVVVVGVPDPMIGQKIRAYVVLDNQCNPSETFKQGLINFAKSKLACYKVPEDIEFVRSIPKNERGKILRKHPSSTNQL